MRTRIVSTAAVVAAVVTLSACSGGSEGNDADLGSGPVTGAVPADAGSSTTSTPSSTSSGTPSGDPSSGSFADRAGIPPQRFVDAAAEIDVPDQSGDGRSVRLGEVRVSRGAGHVAIFTGAGQLLGSARITQGSSPASVSLSTRVPASGELQAVLFTDDGDGRFELAKDRAINDGDTDPDDRLDLEGEDFDYALR